ncbi:uncharacterized protein LOC125030716 isoform X3 [Penaeus chinensis]|uniref:uncharacterized protein LOC125030716 isoform X1 n=1 Tax=Penaeus chinensis TaxID=139456 RepID=UPI001FB70D55|nr:uncharacterized protein LOC125030716 isoform X1 [Penaeus chinensis]XP_047476912.1 uncharacterized protein LOC125030716 isoform X2 [Penaeus chinensis]XP_047476913.1 uncharacterized protein LOC125030716 isoform X3 [Penaeus chinensis]
MYCVDRASKVPLPREHLDVCLKFSKAAGYGNEQGSVDYLHSWTPITLWALVAVFLLPRLAMVCTHTRKAKAIFLDEFGNARPHFDVYQKLKINLGTFDKLYLKAICIDAWAIIAQLFVVLSINLILLPGKVIPIIMDFPWHRDVDGYTDPISIAFPSFLSCKITPDAHLQGLRGSYYGCFHSMATVYLGLFFMIAILTASLFVLTFLHLLYLVLYLPSPCGRRHLVNRGRLHDEVNDLPLRLGDLLMLEYGKHYVNGHEYSDIFKFYSSSQLINSINESSSSEEDELNDVVVITKPVETYSESSYGFAGIFTNNQVIVDPGVGTRGNLTPTEAVCENEFKENQTLTTHGSEIEVQVPTEAVCENEFKENQTLTTHGSEIEVQVPTEAVCENEFKENQTLTTHGSEIEVQVPTEEKKATDSTTV